MALWTPYADDAVLDLSKSSKEDSPSSACPVYPAYYGYNYVPVPHISPIPAAVVPVPQFSPLSAASVSSYETFTPQLVIPERSITPHLLPRVQTLSPPMSPQSQKRPYSMLDDSLSDDPDFQAFERDALRAMAEKNGGALLANNPRMRRTVRSSNESNDDSYRRQRERNNFAAKQSRDRRKLREIHLALKVTYLRKEVAGLKALLASRACSRCHDTGHTW